MQEETQLRCSFVLHIKGKSNSPRILKMAIETFLTSTVLPLIPELGTASEKVEVEMEIKELDKKQKK